MSSGDTCQPSSVILTTSCVVQRRHITVCKVDQHLRECLLSSTAVMPVIGQSRDARKQERRDEAKWRRRAGRRREGKIDADERKGSDRFRREVAREGWRDGRKERNRGRCCQHVCLLRCRFSAPARGTTTQLLPCRPG